MNIKSIKKNWDRIFKEEKGPSKIMEGMSKIVMIFRRNGAQRILDLGCGSGKYTFYLAEKGFQLYGIDISAEGLKSTRQRLKEKGLHAELKAGSIYKRLPYDSAFFDVVVCIRTINHARLGAIKRTIKEIERILKPGGFLLLTTRKEVAKDKRHPFKIIERNTYIPLEGKERGLVHYFLTKASLNKEFQAFKPKIWLDKKKDYFCLLGRKKS